MHMSSLMFKTRSKLKPQSLQFVLYKNNIYMKKEKHLTHLYLSESIPRNKLWDNLPWQIVSFVPSKKTKQTNFIEKADLKRLTFRPLYCSLYHTPRCSYRSSFSSYRSSFMIHSTCGLSGRSKPLSLFIHFQTSITILQPVAYTHFTYGPSH